MTNNPLISIIIPVYNGGQFLGPCIDSIVSQTYQHWQLLLIDDGSTDHSGAICDAYAQRDSRITSVHKQNGGQAAARNDGLSMATGDYVSFVDCDDWLEPDMYATMLSVLAEKQAEVVICGFIEEYTGWQKPVNADGPLIVYDAKEAVKLVLQGKLGSYLWSMLFKRSVVKEKMPDLNPYEDHATIFKWLFHARKVVVLHRAFYHYRQLQNSSLHSYDPRKGNHFFHAIKERYYYIEDGHLLPEWAYENRRLYLRGCIKLTKDLARMSSYNEQMRSIIEEVRIELRKFLPIKRQEIGLKYYIRLRLLLWDIDKYVSLLRFSSVFSFSQHKRSNKLQH